ncbi:Rz1-like lysis system protein LysC [Sodalis sp.]|uniref:Rz1-like lysis system protein LysC n=1 Tax=Sodalis sp. (in: enterobacteria) TaxID=1898979 RepID=UPI003872CBD6
MTVLPGLCLALCLSSCTRPPAHNAEPVVLLPPETVFTPCPRPVMHGKTWGDAVAYALALQTALTLCAGQIDTLNQWRALSDAPSGKDNV